MQVLGPVVMERGVLPAFISSTGALMLEVEEAGHFVQEWGENIAAKAIDSWSWKDDKDAHSRVEGLKYRFEQTPAKGKL